MAEDRLKVTHLLGKKLDEPIVITWESKTESALKPCPFCGGEASLRDEPDKYYKYTVYCTKCGIRTLAEHIESIAIEAWNRRTNKEIEKMRDAHDAAIIYLMKDENIKSTVKGTLPELLVLVGKMLADIDKEAQVND